MYDRFRVSRFPAPPRPDDEHAESDESVLASVFPELLEYDGAVAGVVERVVHGRRVPDQLAHLLTYDSSLECRLEPVASSASPSFAATAKTYLSHLAAIREMLQVARIVNAAER